VAADGVFSAAMPQRSCRSLAARRLEHAHLRGTIRLRAHGSSDVAALSTRRSLDNEIARAIVCADAVHSRHIGNTGWRSPRIAKMLPLLWDAVNTRAMKISGSAMARGRHQMSRPLSPCARRVRARG